MAGTGRELFPPVDAGQFTIYVRAPSGTKLERSEQLLKRIKIESLIDLESKIIGVVVAALAVSFLGSAVDAPDPLSIFHSGIGIALVIGALCLFTKATGSTKK